MNNTALELLLSYRDSEDITKQKLDNYFELCKENAMLGDAFASTAAFVIDKVCYQNLVSTKDELLQVFDGYAYPIEFWVELVNTLYEVVGFR